MKLLLVIILLFSGIAFLEAQSIPKRAEQRSKDKVGSRVDQGVDAGIDSAFNKSGRAIGSIFKKKDKQRGGNASDEAEDIDDGDGVPDPDNRKGSTPSEPATKKSVNRNSDFIPGETVIFEDHFEQDADGDFPAQWNTNGSGRVVTIDGIDGKWLELVHNSVANPVLNKALPENSTIEFDLFLAASGNQSTPFIQFGLTASRDILKQDIFYNDRFFFNIDRYTEGNGKTIEYGLRNDVVGNKSDFPITKYVNKTIHVAMSINKTRIRVYLDDQKLIDLPRALNPAMLNNFFINNNNIMPASELGLFISNIRIADANVDARSLLIKQLMEEGKAVTNDILFDVNSDILKKESFSVIDQIGDALTKNASLKIRIIGHTDSDGTDAANLQLSQKRAAAVKNYITENYAVAGSRIQTDGKGESQPVAPNSTTEGKAKNRRVEFQKI